MDFILEKFIKDKYIGAIDLIKNIGDGRIASAISQLNSDLVSKIGELSTKMNVVYISNKADADYDWVVAINGGKRKRIAKAGFSETWLLKDGVKISEFASNWVANQATVAFGSGYMQIKSTVNGYGFYGCKIDLTNYAKLEYSAKQSYSGVEYGRVGVFNSTAVGTAPVLGTTPTNAFATYTLDISSLKGQYYIGGMATSSHNSFFQYIKLL